MHLLRHTFVTNLLQAGVDVYPLQRLLGHRNPRAPRLSGASHAGNDIGGGGGGLLLINGPAPAGRGDPPGGA